MTSPRPIEPTDAYECTCGGIYLTYDEAQECCPVMQIQAFQCPECGDLYADDFDAEWCCTDEDEELNKDYNDGRKK